MPLLLCLELLPAFGSCSPCHAVNVRDLISVMKSGFTLPNTRLWHQNLRAAPQPCFRLDDDEDRGGQATVSNASMRPKMRRFIGHKRTVSGNILRVLKSPSSWSLPRSPLSQTFGSDLEAESQTHLPLDQDTDETLPSIVEDTFSRSSDESSCYTADNEDSDLLIAKEVCFGRPEGLRLIKIVSRRTAFGKTAEGVHRKDAAEEANDQVPLLESYPDSAFASGRFQGFELAVTDHYRSDVADEFSHTNSTPDQTRDAIWIPLAPTSPRTLPGRDGASRVVDPDKGRSGTSLSPPNATEDIRRSWALADQWLADYGDVGNGGQRYDEDWF